MKSFGITIILAYILTYLAWKNDCWIKQSHQNILMILDRIEKVQNERREKLDKAFRKKDETYVDCNYGSQW